MRIKALQPQWRDKLKDNTCTHWFLVLISLVISSQDPSKTPSCTSCLHTFASQLALVFFWLQPGKKSRNSCLPPPAFCHGYGWSSWSWAAVPWPKKRRKANLSAWISLSFPEVESQRGAIPLSESFTCSSALTSVQITCPSSVQADGYISG